MKIYIGLDNGVSGSIGLITSTGYDFKPVPTKTELSYTKTKQNIDRIVFNDFYNMMKGFANADPCIVILERPLVNPGRFKTTMSAMRCLEAELIALEMLNLPHVYVDSKQWQRDMLPSGIKGSPELKKASMDVGIRLFPNVEDFIKKQKDADGILIAEWARRNNY